MTNQQTKEEKWEDDYYDFYFESGKYEKRKQGFEACKDYIHLLLVSERQRIKQIVIEDVPHIHQDRLLKFLE